MSDFLGVVACSSDEDKGTAPRPLAHVEGKDATKNNTSDDLSGTLVGGETVVVESDDAPVVVEAPGNGGGGAAAAHRPSEPLYPVLEPLADGAAAVGVTEEEFGPGKSFLLINVKEMLCVKSAQEFAAKLGCAEDETVKVVCVVGNTGDGKSHLLNHVFFHGRPVFTTSPSQESCTIGAWAAYDPSRHTVVIDTEGLLGQTQDSRVHMRLLMKILGISDVVIYCSRAERMHQDALTFLSNAGKAYAEYFHSTLLEVCRQHNLPQVTRLGPAVVMYHRPLYAILFDGDAKMREWLGEEVSSAYSAIRYVGYRPEPQGDEWGPLSETIDRLLDNCDVRNHRPLSAVYQPLHHLNKQFKQNLPPQLDAFPRELFVCQTHCLSCGRQCTGAMGHEMDETPHICMSRSGIPHPCKLSAHLNNEETFCKACCDRGERNHCAPHKPKGAEAAAQIWTGVKWDCESCGTIFSPKWWFQGGNAKPLEALVVKNLYHVWKPPAAGGSRHLGRRVVEVMSGVATNVAAAKERPQQALKTLVEPYYFQAKGSVGECGLCAQVFARLSDKHNCRACGRVVCDKCSPHRRAWIQSGRSKERTCEECEQKALAAGNPEGPCDAVAVADAPTTERFESNPNPGAKAAVMNAGKAVSNAAFAVKDTMVANNVPWLAAKVVTGAANVVTTVVSVPMGLVVSATNPSYWVPNGQIKNCHQCKKELTATFEKHHCRACGEGFCEACTSQTRPVPARGWPDPVKVCNACAEEIDSAAEDA